MSHHTLLREGARCGHGGHTSHLLMWFAESDQCPTGCGCPCIEAGIQLAKDVQALTAANTPRFRSRSPGRGPAMVIADDDADFGDILASIEAF